MTPGRYRSGEIDVTMRTSEVGDYWGLVPLYETANVLLTRPVKGGALKRWGLAVAKRAGMRKSKVAVAWKLAVILHRTMADETSFRIEASV